MPQLLALAPTCIAVTNIHHAPAWLAFLGHVEAIINSKIWIAFIATWMHL
jgi:hypothetical protein